MQAGHKEPMSHVFRLAPPTRPGELDAGWSTLGTLPKTSEPYLHIASSSHLAYLYPLREALGYLVSYLLRPHVCSDRGVVDITAGQLNRLVLQEGWRASWASITR